METVDKSIFSQFINNMWKNLSKIIFMSLIWGAIVIPCIFLLPMMISIVILWIIALPILTGIMHGCMSIIKHEKFSYKNIFIVTKKYYLRSLCFYGIILVLTFIVGTSYWQYFKMRSTLYLILSIIQSFFYIVLLMSQMYTVPMMLDKNIKFGEAFKESFKIFQSNSSKTIILFLQLLVMCSIMVLAIITIPLFLGGALSMFMITAYYCMKVQN